MAYKQQTFISHSLEAGKFQTEVMAGSESGEGPLPGSQVAIFSWCTLMAEGKRESSGVP